MSEPNSSCMVIINWHIVQSLKLFCLLSTMMLFSILNLHQSWFGSCEFQITVCPFLFDGSQRSWICLFFDVLNKLHTAMNSMSLCWWLMNQVRRRSGSWIKILDLKTISDITTSTTGLQMKLIICYSLNAIWWNSFHSQELSHVGSNYHLREFHQPGAAKSAWPVWQHSLWKALSITIHWAWSPACCSSLTVSGRSITHRWKHAQEKGSISIIQSYWCTQACYLPTPWNLAA